MPLLESEANLGALEALRAWARDPKKQRAALLANIGKRAAKQIGLKEGSAAFDSFAKAHAALVKAHLSDEDLQSRSALAGAYRVALKRAFRLQEDGESGADENSIEEQPADEQTQKRQKIAREKVILLARWARLSPRETFGLEQGLMSGRKAAIRALATELSERGAAKGGRVQAASAWREWEEVLSKLSRVAKAHGDSISAWSEGENS